MSHIKANLVSHIQLNEMLRNCQGADILMQGTGHIEIVRDNSLERIYFQIPTVCQYLTKESRENLLMEVNRYIELLLQL